MPRSALFLAALSFTSVLAAQSPPLNSMTATERAAGWRLLFDGKSTAGWRNYKADTMSTGWQAVDGALTRVSQAGDIVTREQYASFELAIEWKVEPGANSGIMYRVSEDDDYPFWTGPEYQVLDDAGHADGKSRLTAAGSCFAVYPAKEGAVKPAGEWNATRILVDSNHVEHWLNGRIVAEFDLGSPDWKARVNASKFGPHARFGRNAKGYIAIQDHGDKVAFRNIKIRVLK